MPHELMRQSNQSSAGGWRATVVERVRRGYGRTHLYVTTNYPHGPRVSEQRNQHAEDHAAWTPSGGCLSARAEIDRPSFVELWRESVPYHHAVISRAVGAVCARRCLPSRASGR